jgi:WD40 repeat protein/predicted Ser/Thr protein kinase
MSQRWCCPNGHEWEGHAAGPSAAGLLTTCPMCGSNVVRLASETGASSTLADGTLPLPASQPGAWPPADDATLLPGSVSTGAPPRAGAEPDETLAGSAVQNRGKSEPPAPLPPTAAVDATLADVPRSQPPANQDLTSAATLAGSSPPTPTGTVTELAATPAAGGPAAGGASGAAGATGYEILGELGRGGMGVVYKARQVGLNRLTALKMILAGGYASRDDLARFQREAEAIARLQHPNIVQVYEVGERDGRPFFSLEFIDGGSLQKRLDGTPMHGAEAAGMVEMLARAVHYAHTQGIVHRDLKPANVLLMADGTPKITDFGLAKSVGDDSGQTGTGAVLGTPSYMAPEQAAGRTAQVGPAADVYSLGAILYDLLTGRPPFRGETVLDTLSQVQNDEPVAPRRLQPRVARDLETVCLKCLRKEPGRRYGSALDLAEDLRRFLAREPILARPVTVLERTWKWARRRPGMATLAAALLLTITGGVLGMFVLWQRAEGLRTQAEDASAEAGRRRDDALRQKRAAESARVGAQQAEARAVLARQAAETAYQKSRRQQYAIGMGLAQRALQEGHRDQALKLLARLQEHTTAEEDLRGFEWYYLRRLCRSERLDLKGHVAQITQVAFSPDGTRLATAALDETVRIWDLGGTALPLTLRGFPLPVRGLAFSPDGKQLATAGADGVVLLWDTDSGQRLRAIKAHDYGATAVAFSPDSKHLATTGEDQLACLWDLASGARLQRLAGHKHAVTCVAFSPDGRKLATGGEDHTVRVWDTATGQELLLCQGHSHWVTGVAFSPDGKRLASGSWDQTVRVWDLEEKKPPAILRGHQAVVRAVAFSPDGRYLAGAAADGAVKVWDLSNDVEPRTLQGQPGLVRTVAFSADGQLLASLNFDRRTWDPTPIFTGHGSTVQAVAFSPRGQLVASAGGRLDPEGGPMQGEVKLWDPATCTEKLALHGHAGLVRCLDFSADGTYLASGGGDQTVRVVRTDDGKLVHALRGHANRVTGLRFDPAGRRLASCDEDGVICLWDTTTGKLARRLTGHRGPVHGVAFSADGACLASAGADGTVRIWDPVTGRQLQELKGHAFSVTCVAFNPKNGRLASGSDDQTVKFWDVSTGQCLRTLAGHSHGVTCLAFNPSGRRLASGSEDQTVKLWDAVLGQETLTLHGHTDGVTGVAFSPDGQHLVSSSWDQTVRVWNASRQ